MHHLESLLHNSFDCLTEKIYKIKTIHLRYSMPESHRTFLLRQSILSLYAAWEGFLKESLTLYLQELNKLNLNYSDLSDNYLAYQTDKLCKFKSAKTNQGTIAKLSKDLLFMFQTNVIFETKINTESNANLKVTNNILSNLCLKPINLLYDGEINKFLRFRNSMAHGDDGIPIEQKDIDSFSILVQSISIEVIESIINGFNSKVFLRAS